MVKQDRLVVVTRKIREWQPKLFAEYYYTAVTVVGSEGQGRAQCILVLIVIKILPIKSRVIFKL